jgi:glutathione S-transferase
MIKLHGTSQSRAVRSLWALEEVGAKYEHLPVNTTGESRKPEFLKINPNGHVPALEDNGVVIWESMAINLYVAEKYGKAPLWPPTVEGHAACYQWSFWAMTEVEPPLLTLLMNRLFLPPGDRDEKAALKAIETLQAPLAVLDNHLKGRDNLLGKDFTIADLNVASVMRLAQYVKFDFSATPEVGKWMQRCLGRPAFQKASRLK